MDAKKLFSVIKKINVWSLYYRQEIIWFVVGLLIGVILL
jgi:hypothetical protein